MRHLRSGTLAVLALLLPTTVAAQSPERTAALNSATCPGSGCTVLGVRGLGAVSIQITGTWTATLQFEGSLDGGTFVALSAVPTDSGTTVTSTTSNGVWRASAGGLAHVRVRMSAYTSGTATVTMQGAVASTPIVALPAGTNNIGDVDVATIAAGDNNIGNVDVLSVVPGTAATSLGKAEDAAHTTGDVGVAIIGVRNDGGSTQQTTAAGDYGAVAVDAYGANWAREDHPNAWTCGLDGIGATLTECRATPGTALSLYITDIVAQSTTATAGQFLLRRGTGTNCGTGAASVFPSAATAVRFAYPANTVAPTIISLKTPIKVAADEALCAIGVATNTLTIQITGFTAP